MMECDLQASEVVLPSYVKSIMTNKVVKFSLIYSNIVALRLKKDLQNQVLYLHENNFKTAISKL